MNKKEYMKPAMQVVELNNKCAILAGSPEAHDEPGGSGQFAREFGGWDDDWDEE